jgi:hypothetical protein
MSLFPRPLGVGDRLFPLRGVLALAFLVPLFVLAASVWVIGSRNPYTPAGYVGYLTKGAIFGKARFYGIQRGPDVGRPILAPRRHQRQHHPVHV